MPNAAKAVSVVFGTCLNKPNVYFADPAAVWRVLSV
jgi:hypothetical protein